MICRISNAVSGTARPNWLRVTLGRAFRLSLVVALFAGSIFPADAADTPRIVAHAGTAPQDLTLNAARAIFGMRERIWPDGKPIQVFVLPDDDAVHVAFSEQVLGVFPYQLRQAWDRLVFSGTGQAPLQVASPAEMRAAIARTPGAIGYLPESMIDDHVRVLQIK